MDGEVLESYKSGMYRIALDNGHEALGYTAGKMRRYRIKIFPGDRGRFTPQLLGDTLGCGVVGRVNLGRRSTGVYHNPAADMDGNLDPDQMRLLREHHMRLDCDFEIFPEDRA